MANWLSDKERWYMAPKNKNNSHAQAFRLGLECEARVRAEKIPPRHKDLFEYVEIMCEYHPELSSAEIARRVHYIFTPFTRWERIKRRCKSWLMKLRAEHRKSSSTT